MVLKSTLLRHGLSSQAGKESLLLNRDWLLSPDRRVSCVEHFTKITAYLYGNKFDHLQGKARTAAVLIPLHVNAEDECCILYTQRSANLSRHRREICFPGGLSEVSERDNLAQTALRESHEEIGLDPASVDVWTCRRSLAYPSGTSVITTVVGYVENLRLDKLQLNEDEVESVFSVPIRQLIDANHLSYTQFRGQPRTVAGVGDSDNHKLPGSKGYSMPCYTLPTVRIWGLTACLTYMFLTSLFSSTPNNLYRHQVTFCKSKAAGRGSNSFRG